MKYYLDENGNLIEKPESLREHLKKKAPELSEKLEALWGWRQILDTYRFFLYSIPNKEELESCKKRDPKWEGYINIVNSQEGLEKVLSFIENSSNANMDITNDKVVVVYSERPFYDTLLIEDEKRIGKAEGWVGLVDSYDITDVEGAKFFSHDSKIHKRFVLRQARKLSEDELREWAGANIAYAFHHHNTHGIKACLEKLKESALGNEKVVIYGKYPSIDHAILKHELKEDEKQVAHISSEEARWINLLPYYGERQIQGSQFTLFSHYKSDQNKWGLVHMGKDSRSISEIYGEIKEALEKRIRQMFENPEFKSAHIFVAKLIKNFITPEQREKIKKARYADQNKWFKKYIDEQGLEITDKTIIGACLWRPGQLDVETRKELHSILEDILSPYRYEQTNFDFSYGWNEKCREILMAQTEYDFNWDPELYAGELVIIKNK